MPPPDFAGWTVGFLGADFLGLTAAGFASMLVGVAIVAIDRRLGPEHRQARLQVGIGNRAKLLLDRQRIERQRLPGLIAVPGEMLETASSSKACWFSSSTRRSRRIWASPLSLARVQSSNAASRIRGR